MECFFKPKAVAVIGATPNKAKGGYSILKNLSLGFKGGIYPVNPRYDEIENIKCYSSVADIKKPVDLAIIFIPARFVPAVVEACADNNISGVIIESGGFAESGAEGKAFQKELVRIASTKKIRIWGPNCIGLVDAVNKNVFSFASPVMWKVGLAPGNVSLIVQSGMLAGGFLLDTISHGTMGISKVCSIGNKSDVDECDLLEYMLDDKDTKAIGLYLESISDGARFLNLCRRSKKPIVVVKGGKSKQGAQAAMSHTASLAGNRAVIKSTLASAGVIETKDFKQMMDYCRALAIYSKLPESFTGKIAVLTYSGGAGIVSTDYIEEMGLTLAEFQNETISRLKTVFPDWMPASNPVDLWPAVEQNGPAKTFEVAIDAVCQDPGVEAILLHASTGNAVMDLDMKKMSEKVKKSGRLMFCWLLGTIDAAKRFHIDTQKHGVPVYRELYRSVECINGVFSRHKYIKDIKEYEKHTYPGKIPENLLAGKTYESLIFDEFDSKAVLKKCNIKTVEEEIVLSGQGAEESANKIGFPVVLKGLIKGSAHKTEKGLVRLNIGTGENAKLNFAELQKGVGANGKIIVQKQLKDGLELIIGFFRDPQFGPCVMFGLGGVFAEIIEDVEFATAPLSMGSALHLISRIKSEKLLNGFRGAKKLDRNEMAKILVSLGNLGCCYSIIKEIDINPLIVTDGIPIVVDANIIFQQTVEK